MHARNRRRWSGALALALGLAASGCARDKLARQGVIPVRPAVVRFLLDVRLLVDDLDLLYPLDQTLQKAAHDQACVWCAETEVSAEAERDVRVRFAIEPDLVRIVEHRLVEVCRSPA